VPQCSHLLHWPCHQQCLANCDWMPASYTSNLPILASIQPVELHCRGAVLSLARRAMKPGHLFHQHSLSSSSSATCRTGAPEREKPIATQHPVRNCVDHPASIPLQLLVIFFAWPFNWNVSLMLACLGTPDLITVLFFSASWQTVYYENANAIPSLSPINLTTTTTCPPCRNALHIKSRHSFVPTAQ